MGLSVIFLFFAALTAEAQSHRTDEWPTEFSRYLTKSSDRIAYAFSNAIFDVLDQIDGYFPIGKHSKLGLGYQRKIYEDRVIGNTWTVEDHFRVKVPFKVSLGEMKEKIIDASSEAASRTLGLEYGFSFTPTVEWIEFRKVQPREIDSIPRIEDEVNKIISSDWYQHLMRLKKLKKKERSLSDENEILANAESPLEVSPEDADRVEEELRSQQETKRKRKFMNDPAVRPRFKSVFNPFKIPFKMPYNSDQVSSPDIQSGSIFIYNGSGTLEAHIGAGLPLTNPLRALSLNASANVTAYLSGDFRVAVFKESDRYVWVKVVKVTKLGGEEGIGFGRAGNLQIGSWLKVSESNPVGKIKWSPKITPFRYTEDQSISWITNMTFRYDMGNPDARRAFNRAVWGLMADSQALAELEADLPDDWKTVMQIGAQHIQSKLTGTTTRSKGDFLFDSFHRRATVDSKIKSKQDDGIHQLIKTEASNQYQTKFLGGISKKGLRFNFTVMMDETAWKKGRPDSYGLIAEGFLEDYFTSAKELNHAIKKTEEVLGNPDFLNGYPERVRLKPNGRTRKLSFGRTSFYYGLTLNQSQVDRFLNVHPSEMWKFLEIAFEQKTGAWENIKKSTWTGLGKRSSLAQARIVYKRWVQAHKEQDPMKRIHQLGQLVSARIYGYELFRLFKAVQDGDEVDTFANVYSNLFGRLEERKKARVSIDELRVRTEPPLNIEQKVLRFNGDVTATVASFSEQAEPNTVMSFQADFSKKPKTVYMGLFKSPAEGVVIPITDFYLENTSGRFSKGLNSWKLDSKADDEIYRMLGSLLEPNKYFALWIAYSEDGKTWGQVKKVRFLTRR